MEIFSACPFAVSTLAWEPAPGRHSVSVCVKATFALAPGTAAIAPMQEPVGVDRGEGGLAAAADLVPFKPRAEVILVGHAYAPGGAPIDTLLARARVGAFRKSLSITGDRAWVPSFDGLRPSVAVPFRRMPLRYDRAVRTGANLGGVDITQGAELGRPLANIAAIADQGGETPGFGPLPLEWRAHRLGLAHDALLWASRVALGGGPPPPGFDFRAFNAAPAEQQIDEIPPGVEILLEHLSPDHPRLEARLPPIRVLLFRRAAPGDRAAELPVRCDTLWIDTDRALAFAIWRGAVPLAGPEEAAEGTLVVAAVRGGEAIGAGEVDRFLDRIEASVATYVDVAAAFAAAHASDAPAQGAQEEAPPAEPADDADAHDAPTPPPPDGRGARTTLAPPAEGAPQAEALPFRAPPTGFETAAGRSGPYKEALPFGWGPRPAEARADHDDDAELTPPRGYPPAVTLQMAPPPPDLGPETPPRAPHPSGPFGTIRPEAAPADTPPMIVLRAAPATPPMGLAEYAAIKAESFRAGMAVGEILRARGLDEAAFRAHEAREVVLIAAEAAEGRADRAIALFEALRG